MEQAECTYRLSAKALIKDGDKILCILEKTGVWSLPGGGVEHNENPIDSLKREIEEETGLEVTDIKNDPVFFFTFKNWNGSYRANIVYQVVIQDLNFTPSEECVDVKYYTKQEITKLRCNSDLENLLKYL